MRTVLLDLLMATMDSMATWASAVGDRERGLAWRDAVTARMVRAGRYVPYDELVRSAAGELGLAAEAPDRLRAEWADMRPWPDAPALERSGLPYAFVTNTSAALAAEAVARSGLEPRFVLSAEEAGWFKPRPEVYRAAIERMGMPMSAIRYVAGARYDALGAAEVGLDTALVARRPPEGPIPERIAVVRSLEDALA